MLLRGGFLCLLVPRQINRSKPSTSSVPSLAAPSGSTKILVHNSALRQGQGRRYADPVTRQEIEQKMDELAREYRDTHDPEIPEEIFELARRLKEMEH
jgi:hypothetical protein